MKQSFLIETISSQVNLGDKTKVKASNYKAKLYFCKWHIVAVFLSCFFGTYHKGWKLNNALFADMSKDLEKPDAFKVK